VNRDCAHLQSLWRRLYGRIPGVLLEGSRYCLGKCLEDRLSDALERVRSISKRAPVRHRIPLGLLLLSRQHLTAQELRSALQAQRNAGHGRLGEWLLALGLASEEKITAALARQWSCPVLLSCSSLPRASGSPRLPWTLLETFAMIPVDYVESTFTLHIAFGEGLDHSVLYAIEKMTGTRTEPCMAPSSFIRRNLQIALLQRREREVVFECPTGLSECCRIVRNYCARLSASEIRIAGCGPFIWVRLFQASRTPVDVLFRDSTPSHCRPVLTRSLKSIGRIPMSPITGEWVPPAADMPETGLTTVLEGAP